MKDVKYLIEYVKGQVGRPYWGGTYGLLATQQLLDSKRAVYPKLYPTPGNPPFTSQFGQKVHDCNGLVYAASVCDTPNSYPKSYPSPYYAVPTLFKHCEDIGVCNPETIIENGELLFRNNNGHVGVYADGYVYHAKGHAWGVVKEKYNYKSWIYHGKFKEMYNYSSTPTPKKVTITCSLPFIQLGSKGDAVKIWQMIVKTQCDGIFGSKTDAQTKAFQKAEGIEVDGQVGKDSWTHGLNSLTAQ